MINEYFYEKFDREEERFARKQAKQNKCRKKVEGYGDVTGTDLNREGQEMARILFRLNEGSWPTKEQTSDYLRNVTKGHLISITEPYLARIATEYGEEYSSKDPSVIADLIEKENQTRILETAAENWKGVFFSASPLRNGHVLISSTIFGIESKIKPEERRIEVNSGIIAYGNCIAFPRGNGIEEAVYVNFKKDTPEFARKRMAEILTRKFARDYKNNLGVFRKR